MINMFNRALLIACLMIPMAAMAQVCLVSKGKQQGRIVLVEDNDVNRKAATLLQRFVRETSGGDLKIIATTKHAKNDVLIGGRTSLRLLLLPTYAFLRCTCQKVLHSASDRLSAIQTTTTLTATG